MINSGFSLAKGSARNPLAPTWPAVFGSPPVQAGMLPLALPSFCAPRGVRLVPSWSACWGETAAMTLEANSINARDALVSCAYAFMFSKAPGSKGHADAERQVVAVNVGIEVAAEVIGVTQADGVGVSVVGIEADAHGLGAFVEGRTVAVDIVGPRQIGAEVDPDEYAGVLKGAERPVTPGVLRVVAVAPGLAQVAEDRVAAITLLVQAFQPADVGHADFHRQRHRIGTDHRIEQVQQGGLRLGDFLALPALDDLPFFAGYGWLDHAPGQRLEHRVQRTAGEIGGVD